MNTQSWQQQQKNTKFLFTFHLKNVQNVQNEILDRFLPVIYTLHIVQQRLAYHECQQ